MSKMDRRAQSGLWAAIECSSLHRLITEQLPRFAERPYLQNAAEVTAALSQGLDISLEGDFCWSLSFEPSFLRMLIYEGFLPICCE